MLLDSQVESMWHPTSNLPLNFNDIDSTKKKYWWIEPKCGHSFEKNIYALKNGSSCPYCAGKQILIGFNDLASNYPEIAKQWHPTKNGDATPFTVSRKSSSKNYWWIDEFGHEWKQKVLHRANGSGCPACAGYLLIGFNDLSTTHPEIASEWHPTLNTNISIDKIGQNYKNRVWWLCPLQHDWHTSVANRTRSNVNCQVCANNQFLRGFNDLESHSPDLAQQWHKTLNGTLKPSDVKFNDANTTAWWLCQNEHAWETKIANRQFRGCPYCYGNKILIGTNDLNTVNPKLASEWHPTKNRELTTSQFTGKSGKKVWWLGKCGHEWEAQISNRANGAGCSYCGSKNVIVGITDLNSDIIKMSFWDFQKNNNLDPKTIFKYSSKEKYWWLCSVCEYSWESTPSGVTNCGTCSGKYVKVGFNDLATTHPLLAAEWHPTLNGNMKPTDISYGNRNKIWWICDKGHAWKTQTLARSSGNNCHYCSSTKVLSGFNDLLTKNPSIAAEWHPSKNADLLPENIMSSARRKIWWLGVCGHEWESRVSDRHLKNSGCPQCANHVSKAETEIREFIENLGSIVDPSNTTILHGKEIDIYIPSVKFGIEFNGIYWHSDKYRSDDFHINKYKAAQTAGVQLIQIWEDDWMSKKDLVMRMLANKLSADTQLKTLFPQFTDYVENIDASTTTIAQVSEVRAKKFFNDNHLHGFAKGDFYLGLQDTNQTLRAVISVKHKDNNELSIARYAEFGSINHGFKKLLDKIRKQYNPLTISVITDNTLADDAFYLSHGFVVRKECVQDYMYVVKNERKHKSEYTLDNFKNNPRLKFENNLTEKELAVLNNIARIWDAGSTEYILAWD